MKKLIALIAALCVTVAAAPASSLALDHDVHAAAKKKKKNKKKKKKSPRYRVSINFDGTNETTTTCIEGEYTVVEKSFFTTKWSQTGVYPGGESRRTGYTESWLERESNDPYLPSYQMPKVRKEVSAIFGKGDWPVQINAKRTKFSYEWKGAAGHTEDSVMKAPTKVGKTTRKRFISQYNRPGDTSGVDTRPECETEVRDKVTHEVIITRTG